MSKRTVDEQTLRAMADKIRSKKNITGDILFPDEFISAYDEINNGITPSGIKYITSNGEYDVAEFANANVNVPVPEGYVIPSGSIDITSNGTHNVAGKATANVNVPVPSGYIQPSGNFNITVNGTHNVRAYENAVVNVSSQYYATSLNPSSNTLTVSFNVGFTPKLFLIASVNSFTNSTTTRYITTLWYCADLTGAGYGAYAGGLTVHKESSAGRLTSYTATDMYSCSNGVVTINDNGHYFKSGNLYRVFAMA